jgi:hypothetical protein
MAISVAPLTTTVMSSVDEVLAGVASGINNAVSRAAGLLAIAVFGVFMLQVFSRSLQAHLEKRDLPESTRQFMFDQRIKLAEIQLPQDLPASQQDELRLAIAESFVAGYRVIIVIAASLALLGSGCGWLLIGREK